MNADKNPGNWLIAGLVFAGLLLIGGIVAQGFHSEPPPPAPQALGATTLAQIVRRKVPGLSADEIRRAGLSLKEAMYYEKLPGGRVQCTLCPVMCVLGEGERGSCRARINIGGILRTLVYGRLLAANDDPIEKKPLFHFLPGSRSLSIATAGCNLGCVFCQNWQISQALPEEAPHMTVTPEQVVAEAKRQGCRSISFTYTEPTIFYEFMLDTARLAHQQGIRTVWITCGYINPTPLRELCKVLDAANIDVKGFSESYYQRYCGGSLEPVLTALRIAREEKVWVEVTNLIVPGGNDDPRMISDLCQWHMAHLGPDVPLHFSRFFPMYRMLDADPTPLETLQTAARIARDAGIHYVYIGNIATPSGEDTICPKCGHTLVRRRGFDVLENDIRDGRCPYCGAQIAGVWTAK
jgi:pyruvate formate lyase activating enzyme